MRRHARPLHRLRKRPTYRHHIRVKRRERHLKKQLNGCELPEISPPSPEAVELPYPARPLEQRAHSLAEDLHDWILGGQDGLVNVLGSILGIAVVTSNKYIIIVAGLAALSAESISMAAVAYTSVKASQSYYHSQKELRRKAIEENPMLQREILIDIYERKGLSRGEALRIIAELTKSKEVWLKAILEEHLGMHEPEDIGPLRSALIVGCASLIGSIIPLLPFFFLARGTAIVASCSLSITVLFAAGAASAKLTIGDWRKRGAEMAAIGGAAAAVSFGIGLLAKAFVGI